MKTTDKDIEYFVWATQCLKNYKILHVFFFQKSSKNNPVFPYKDHQLELSPYLEPVYARVSTTPYCLTSTHFTHFVPYLVF